jgi:DNA-binding transcriptional MerR regulator
MFSDVLSISWPDLKQLTEEDPDEIDRFARQFSERVFNARHVSVSSQELQSWEAQAFLPYAYKDKGWRKFSFIETVWLKCIQKLRSLDVSHKKIVLLKESFFSLDKEELLTIIQLTPMLKGIGMKKYLVMAQLENDEKLYRWTRRVIRERQQSRFSFLVLWILMYKTNIGLMVDEYNKCHFVVLGPDGIHGVLSNEVKFTEFQHKSFVLLNLRNIVREFFDDERLELDDAYLVGFLTKAQNAVLEKLKTAGAKSITVRMHEGDPTYIEITKEGVTNEIEGKLARLLNKTDFKHIEFKTRAGKLITYSETEIVKLK